MYVVSLGAESKPRHLNDDDIRWFLALMYTHAVQRGRQGDWHDPNWSMLDMGGRGCTIKNLDATWRTARTTGCWHPVMPNYVIAVAFSPDGERLASASWQEVIIWDTRTGAKIGTLHGLVGPIQSVAFSRDGKLAAAGGFKGKGEIKIWDRSLWDKQSVACGP